MSRYRAGSLHLALSLAIAALVFVGVYFVWYPGALLQATGAPWILAIIALLHLGLGPLLTTIVFETGKRGLAFDLLAIVIVQTGALAFGIWMLYQSRPAYIVFIKDRFELARADDIDPDELSKAKPPYDQLPLTGPRIVGAHLPRDPHEQFRVMMSAMQGGPDIQGFPQYFVPYDEVRQQAAGRAEVIGALRKWNAKDPGGVDALVKSLGGREERLRFLPMRAGKHDLTVVLDADSGEVLRIVALQPWEFE